MKRVKAAFLSVVLIHTMMVSGQVSPKKSMDLTVENNSEFSLQYIRSATVKLTYKGITILVDPILADKGVDPPILYSNDTKNPTIELPLRKEHLIKDIDAVLLTHYHSDHFDSEAERLLPKDLIIFCQPGDDKKLREKGFKNPRVIDSSLNWQGISLNRFRASHYEGADGKPPFGESSSYSLKIGKTSVFITGDAILDGRLKGALRTAQPNLIVANTGECQFTKDNPILAPGATMTLTAGELKEISSLLPTSITVAVHMDGINHCKLTKADLKAYILNNNLKTRIKVPDEGTILQSRQLLSDLIFKD